MRKKKKLSIVTPANARTLVYRAHLEEISESGLCPFCPGGQTLKKQEILHQNLFGWASHNFVPLNNSQFHFIIVPHQHIESLEEIKGPDWGQFLELLAWLNQRYKIDGEVLYVRQGSPHRTGATVSHLHFQIIVPKKSVTLYFGPPPS